MLQYRKHLHHRICSSRNALKQGLHSESKSPINVPNKACNAEYTTKSSKWALVLERVYTGTAACMIASRLSS